MPQHTYAAHDGGFLPQLRSTLLVAAGSNEESAGRYPTETIVRALDALTSIGAVIRRVSRFYATPCFPPGAGPDYVNAAFKLDLAGDVRSGLGKLHAVEAELGRVRAERWAQRTLDLDLIACGQQVLPDLSTLKRWIGLPPEQQRRVAPAELILPHPRMQDRSFVLVPLMDIAPNWVHPVIGKTVKQMLDALHDSDRNDVIPLEIQPEHQYTSGF